MPERHDLGNETLSMLAGMLATAGLVCLAGAALAYATGEDLGAMTSHLEATMVLGVLGLAFLLCTIFPVHTLRQRAKESVVSRDDWG